jgi:hypothetical protein
MLANASSKLLLACLEELRLLNSDERNRWRVKLLNNPKLAQNVLKRLNKENETELEPLNTGRGEIWRE